MKKCEGDKGISKKRPSSSCFTDCAVIIGVLGIFSSTSTEFLARLKSRKSEKLEISVKEIEGLIAERTAARKAKDFKRSDEIRDLLLSKNIALLDSPQGTTWSVR